MANTTTSPQIPSLIQKCRVDPLLLGDSKVALSRSPAESFSQRNWSQFDKTTVRDIAGTVYRNDSGRIRLTIINIYLAVSIAAPGNSGTSQVLFYCDENSSPTALIQQLIIGLNMGSVGSFTGNFATTILVPPGYFYKAVQSATGDGVTPVLTSWFENELY